MSRRRAATGLAAGLAVMVAAPVIWWVTQPEPAGQTVSTVNAAAAADLASPSPVTSGVSGMASASSAAPDLPSSSQQESTPTQAADAVSAPPAAPPVDPPAPAPSPAVPPMDAPPIEAPPIDAPPIEATAPTRIEIPALGIDTVVVSVGVDDAGLMEVPQDVDTVGWYRYGPAPGAAAGSAVLSGHVDDYRQGPGAFARIGDLGPSDVVRVTDDSGVSREFTVLAREQWNKGEVPLDRLFDRSAAPRLVLITCGGSFNSSTLGYDDNIAITAVPISQ